MIELLFILGLLGGLILGIFFGSYRVLAYLVDQALIHPATAQNIIGNIWKIILKKS